MKRSWMRGSGAGTRREFVVTALGGVSVVLLSACGGDDESDGASGGSAGVGGSGGSGASGGSAGSGGTAGVSGSGGSAASGGSAGAGGSVGDGGSCVLYPQQTEGPFYLDDDLVRSDITEGKAGAGFRLRIRVLSANGCTPVANAAVDVWQCDAGGVYSGYPGQLGGLDTTGQTFLRGTQVTDSDGWVEFMSIYPGWYPGRTTHIHFKVHPTPNTEATSQLYFPEDVTTAIYQTAPYDARGQKDTSNAADAIAQSGGMPPVCAVSKAALGYEGTLTVTVA